MGPDLSALGRALLFFGAILALVGFVLLAAPKLPWLGRLPGDLLIQRGRFTCYVPLTTSLVVSVLLSLLLWIVGRFRQ